MGIVVSWTIIFVWKVVWGHRAKNRQKRKKNGTLHTFTTGITPALTVDLEY